MSTASAIRDRLVQPDITAYTLALGYATLRGSAERAMFDCAHIAEDKRNDAGRCTMMIATYPDGSALKFTWSPAAGSKLSLHETDPNTLRRRQRTHADR